MHQVVLLLFKTLSVEKDVFLSRASEEARYGHGSTWGPTDSMMRRMRGDVWCVGLHTSVWVAADSATTSAEEMRRLQGLRRSLAQTEH